MHNKIYIEKKARAAWFGNSPGEVGHKMKLHYRTNLSRRARRYSVLEERRLVVVCAGLISVILHCRRSETRVKKLQNEQLTGTYVPRHVLEISVGLSQNPPAQYLLTFPTETFPIYTSRTWPRVAPYL